MQKLFFTILLVVAVLVTIRLYKQKEARETAAPDVGNIFFINRNAILPVEPQTGELKIAPTPNNDEFEEEHPEITANDEETLIEE